MHFLSQVSELEQDMPSLHEQISYMKEQASATKSTTTPPNGPVPLSTWQLRVLETAWHPHIEDPDEFGG